MATFHLMTHKGKWVRGTAKAAVPRSWEKERKMRKFLFTPTTQSDETDADYRNIWKILIKQVKEQVTLKVPAMFCSCTSYHSNGNIKLNTGKYTPSAYLTFAIYFSKSPQALTNVKYISYMARCLFWNTHLNVGNMWKYPQLEIWKYLPIQLWVASVEIKVCGKFLLANPFQNFNFNS